MIGKPYLNPKLYTDPTPEIISPSSSSSSSFTPLNSYDALVTALSRYLPSNNVSTEPIESDNFRMYEFKVRICTRPKAHDWTECPFAHPGEKARRRDPARYSYSGTACTDFRKLGGCRRGDACEFAHGVFECWLHPTRYRTQPCKDGSACTRRVCFFAHSSGQLRVGSGQPSPISMRSGSPDPFEESPPLTPVSRVYGPDCTRRVCFLSNSSGQVRAGSGQPSPISIGSGSSDPFEESPPLTPAYGPGAVAELAATLRSFQLSKANRGLGSPRFGRTGFYSLPETPTGGGGRAGLWESRLGMEEPVDNNTGGSGPDIGWVSELIK